MAQLSRRGGFLVVAARAGVLAAAMLACESKALQPLGGAGAAAKPIGDASLDHLNADATPAPLGTACTGSGGCLSGYCVEGVCCTSACAGGCQTCSAPAPGTCLARVAASRPRQTADCPPSAPATCGLDGTCDGAGACRFYLLGSTCISGVCTNGAVTGGGVCDGQGSCRPGPTVVCAPYDCDSATGRCKASCASDDDCSGGQHCHNGACGDPPRESCAANEECASGFCSDGVCCNTKCAGLCVSCALPGLVGTCSPTPAGGPDRTPSASTRARRAAATTAPATARVGAIPTSPGCLALPPPPARGRSGAAPGPATARGPAGGRRSPARRTPATHRRAPVTTPAPPRTTAHRESRA